ncbi:FG-GAP repeat domain-containing protein [Streptomyces sp. PB17]|uniref:FG-GAP repeat domain-containing protein n=1 Tax=Streptomyces sp. PB17 TaxID=3384158 RepID=UPI0038B58AD1
MRWLSAALISVLVAGSGLTGSTAPAEAAAACPSGVESDFNGDGVRDMVIADPEATVGGYERAGEVHVVYGGGKGTLSLHQDTTGVPGAVESGDQFGAALAVYDANLDGCSDLAVGIPYEDLTVTSGTSSKTYSDAGLVQVMYGSADGLVGASSPVANEYLQGEGKPLGGAPEHEDWIGFALAAGKSAGGVPFLLIGGPGEDLGTVVDPGIAFYIHGTARTVAAFHQDTVAGGDVPGVVEADDRFGASVVATPTHFAVGEPGEALGTKTFAGGAAVFSHTLVSTHPKPLFGLAQDQEPISSDGEVGDGFATSMAMVPYRPSGATATSESLLAVGVPGEDLEATVDAGAVHIFRITASGTFTETEWITQDSPDVYGGTQPGDFFGQSLAAVNTAPNNVSSATTVRLAIGVPGDEYSQEYVDRGGVHTVPMVGAPGASDSWVNSGYGIPPGPAPHVLAGTSLAATPGALLIGLPYGPPEGHAVHGYKWNGTTGEEPTVTYKPGEGGLPADSKAFGAVVR